ncbi:hypothetical protein, conserved [Eimeria maxima]|uniref:Uncharacterized protein n=1 Tax=Eimeria maxima TaxID=5804 RepID=U6M5P6_EIMMA|nr:hypothetical protein, conserved [Eimeria maxima]CDJ56995.1 hypothetical protein, conserved [Eimeria maxima]
MEYFTSTNAKAAAFQVGSVRYSLPVEVMGRSDVQASGLALVVRREGFKDIPPRVPKTEDGALQLNRPQMGFELMVEHLLGMQPLKGCPLKEFAEKYIALKTELLYWQLPTADVAFDDRLYYTSAWTDGDCFYPLRREDAAAFSRSEAEAHRPANVVQLQDSSIPEEIKCFLEDVKGDFQCWATPEPTQNNAEGAAAAASAANQTNRLCIAAGEDRFLCLPPGLQRPCVHFAALPDRNGFAPFAVAAGPLEYTLVWSPGAFLHLRGEQKKSGEIRYQLELIIKKPAWLCIHPTLGSVLSGVEGPVPHIFCFGMPDAQVVRFFPWGALAINGEVICDAQAKTADEQNSTQETRGVTAQAQGRGEPKPALAATFLRLFNKSFEPPLRICFLNTDKEGKSVTLKRLKDFDVHDTRNEEVTGFNIMLALKGALAEARADRAVPDKQKPGKTIVFQIDSNGQLVDENQIVIDGGGPRGEELFSIAVYGEYDCTSQKYYTFETGKKLFDFHRQMFMNRSLQHSGNCNIM